MWVARCLDMAHYALGLGPSEITAIMIKAPKTAGRARLSTAGRAENEHPIRVTNGNPMGIDSTFGGRKKQSRYN